MSRQAVTWLNCAGALQRLSGPCVQPVKEEEEQENLMMQRMLGHANCVLLSAVWVNLWGSCSLTALLGLVLGC